MKTKELNKSCEIYLETLISKIKDATSSEELLNYLDFCSKFHHYSFHNRLCIWSANPSATHVAGFKTWQKMGRWVKKGEKGIPIFAPIKIKQPESQIDELDPEEIKIFFKVVYVWDVSQTEGNPLPEAPDTLTVDGEISDLLPILEAVVHSHGINLEYVDKLRGYGVSKIKDIKVLASIKDKEKFRVLAHELSHELLHGRQERMDLSRKVKEFEAEATSYIVCRHFDLEPRSPTYLALYRVEEVDIKESLDRIVSTASSIIQGIVREKTDNSMAEAA